MRIRAVVTTFLAVAALAAPALADDFTDQLDEAKTAYAKHDLGTAQAALNSASQLLRQQRVELWKAVLPDPQPGWKAEDAEGAAAAMALLGGGVSVSRNYRKDSETVNIEIVTDSPIIASMSGLLNGLITLDGAKLIVMDGHKVTYNKNENSYMTMIGDKALVTVKGQGKVPEDELKTYVKAIKFAEIEKLLK